MGYLIKNACIFTNNDKNQIINDQAVFIDHCRVREIGPASELQKKYAVSETLDGHGKLLMPGWINAHMHCYSTYARGLALQKSAADFIAILNDLWWRLDKALDAQAIFYSALIPALSAIKSGVTSIIDHHASPMAIDGSLDRIEQALEKVGLRAVLCYEVSDRDGRQKARQGLHENERYILKCNSVLKDKADSLFNGMIGLHASFTLGDETLGMASTLGRQLKRGFHLHLAEGEDDNDPRYQGARAVPRLQQFEILGPQTLVAHAIHLTAEEIQRLADSGTMVVINPQSNMNNAVGRADIFSMLKQGILLGLGSDGMNVSLYPEMRTAYLLPKHDLRNPGLGWHEIQQVTLKNNPQIYQRLTGQKIGRIEAGCLADLILIDYYPPTPISAENIWGHILFGIADAPVDTTIINGKIVLRHKQLVDLDEAEIAAKSREFAKKVWQKF